MKILPDYYCIVYQDFTQWEYSMKSTAFLFGLTDIDCLNLEVQVDMRTYEVKTSQIYLWLTLHAQREIWSKMYFNMEISLFRYLFLLAYPLLPLLPPLASSLSFSLSLSFPSRTFLSPPLIIPLIMAIAMEVKIFGYTWCCISAYWNTFLIIPQVYYFSYSIWIKLVDSID